MIILAHYKQSVKFKPAILEKALKINGWEKAFYGISCETKSARVRQENVVSKRNGIICCFPWKNDLSGSGYDRFIVAVTCTCILHLFRQRICRSMHSGTGGSISGGIPKRQNQFAIFCGNQWQAIWWKCRNATKIPANRMKMLQLLDRSNGVWYNIRVPPYNVLKCIFRMKGFLKIWTKAIR